MKGLNAITIFAALTVFSAMGLTACGKSNFAAKMAIYPGTISSEFNHLQLTLSSLLPIPDFNHRLLSVRAAQQKSAAAVPEVTIAPRSSATVSAQVIDPAKEPAISEEEKLRLLRGKIKYVFVLFQENRSFDFYFGTYPGADGLYAGPNGATTADQVAGFTQAIVNTDGSVGTVTPFRIPAAIVDATGKTVPLYPADIA